MKNEFVKINEKRGGRIYQLFAESLNKVNPSYKDISCANIDQMKKHLQKVYNSSTSRLYFVMFKRIVSLISINCPNLEHNWRDLHRNNPPLGCQKESVYLTTEEIIRIANIKGLKGKKKVVRDQFLIGCLTGARYSDFSQLKKENIFNGYLTYISQKTHIRAKVPVSALLEKLFSNQFTLCTSVSLTAFEKFIRVICRMAGIDETVQVLTEREVTLLPKWKLVSSHTARRSFCRNLAMYNTPIFTIRDLAGHTNIAMTERYIGRNLEFVEGKKMMDYFNSFS